jgi:hypothetical protein
MLPCQEEIMAAAGQALRRLTLPSETRKSTSRDSAVMLSLELLLHEGILASRQKRTAQAKLRSTT